MSKKSVGIVGFGDFTKLMVRHLSPHFTVYVSSRRHIVNKQGLDFTPVKISDVFAQEIIIPSVPSQYLHELFTTNKSAINTRATVIDVCSVKVKPVQTLLEVLPKSCSILATHPLFGPASARHGLKGQKIMLYPVRISDTKYEQIKQFLVTKFGLTVLEVTPEEHDKAMAYAQGLSHYIGRAMQLMDIPSSELDTKAYKDLLDMKNIQGNDSLELFDSIMHDNPYAKDVHALFKETLERLDAKLGLR